MTNQIDHNLQGRADPRRTARNGPRLALLTPARSMTPTTLTTEQVAAFNRDGYLKGFRIFRRRRDS